MKRFLVLGLAFGLAILAPAATLARPTAAEPNHGERGLPAGAAPPGPLGEVRFDQKLGDSVPLDAVFTDEDGRKVALGDVVPDGRAWILALVYYECPMLCTLTLNGLTNVLRTIDLDPGTEFDVVAVSFDPGEGPELAAAKKDAYVRRFGREETADGWHFLTGDEDALGRLTESVGFRSVYDAEADEYAHAAGIVVMTAEGRIARYFYGVEYPARDVRLGLVEASEGSIGSFADQVLLFCFHYDPELGRYSRTALLSVRAGALVTLALLGGFLTVQFRRERRNRRKAHPEAGGDA